MTDPNAVRRKASKSVVVRRLDVYDGIQRAGGIIVAYDADDNKIGSFRTLQDATAAISK